LAGSQRTRARRSRQRVRGREGSFLVDLVDVFCGDCKPFVITTNCPNEKFVARYGERIVDRLRECGAFFEWSGPSLRGRRRRRRSRFDVPARPARERWDPAGTGHAPEFATGARSADRAAAGRPRRVRAILAGAGAPARDLDWLVASCASVEDGRGYRPPPRHAWCVDGRGVAACDDLGCIACQGVR
jgi:hypothetical protein